VRGTLGQQPVVVDVRALSPTPVGVVTGLLGQRRIIVDEDDLALLIHTVHGTPRYRMLVTSDDVSEDEQWRRPAGARSDGDAARSMPATPPAPPYTGPPRTTPPPPDWRPRLLVQPPAPRRLPPQDEEALDVQAREARTITYGVGMLAGAILLIVLFILCGRAI
jgi:hypothetical protein